MGRDNFLAYNGIYMAFLAYEELLTERIWIQLWAKKTHDPHIYKTTFLQAEQIINSVFQREKPKQVHLILYLAKI